MARLGISRHGVGAAHFAPQGQRLNAENYVTVTDDVFKADCEEIFGRAGVADFAFQQDGASAHTSKLSQKFREGNFPAFIPKGQWPPNSPDMSPLDYFMWAEMQRRVDQKQPASLTTLKLAIRQSAAEVPLATAQRAIDGFYKRCKLAIEAGGKPFKHMLKRTGLPAPPQRAQGQHAPDGPLLDQLANADLVAELNIDADSNEAGQDEPGEDEEE